MRSDTHDVPSTALGSGSWMLPASTNGDTATARAYFDPSGSTGMMPPTFAPRALMMAGPLALSSTSFAMAWGHRAVMFVMATHDSVKLIRARTWSTSWVMGPRRSHTCPTT
jgi:hypothetical protein